MSKDERDKGRREIQGEGSALLIESRIEQLERGQNEAKKRDEEYKRFQIRYNQLLAWFTGGLLITSVILNVIYIDISRSTRQSVIAAKNANQNAKEAVETVQRAFVTFKAASVAEGHRMRPPRDKLLDFTATLENSGNTWATLVARYVAVDYTPDGVPSISQFLGSRKDWLTMPGQIAARSPKDIGPIEQTEKYVLGELTLSPSDVDAVARLLKPGKLCIWGWAIYRDSFPSTPVRLTEFCARITMLFVDPKLGLLPNLRACQAHNCTDESCDDYQEMISQAYPKGLQKRGQ